MQQFSKERSTPGLDQVGNINFGPKNQPASMDHIRTIPKKLACPFGLSDCRGCKIALNVDNKIECSITILAKSTLKTGFNILTKEKNGN